MASAAKGHDYEQRKRLSCEAKRQPEEACSISNGLGCSPSQLTADSARSSASTASKQAPAGSAFVRTGLRWAPPPTRTISVTANPPRQPPSTRNRCCSHTSIERLSRRTLAQSTSSNHSHGPNSCAPASPTILRRHSSHCPDIIGSSPGTGFSHDSVALLGSSRNAAPTWLHKKENRALWRQWKSE